MEDPNVQRIMDIYKIVSRLEQKVDIAIATARGQNRRISSLEGSRTYTQGMFAAIGAIGGFVGAIASKFWG